ncbi:MAG: alanine racemase [Anaerolineales bacterium]
MITLNDLIAATCGLLRQPGPHDFAGWSFDSRRTHPGELFVALVTATGDGHDHVADAVAAGAKGVLCQQPVSAPDGVAVVQVPDTTDALLAYARYVLAARRLPVVAVTGSSGKTTTKELIATILAQGRAVFRSPESFNGRLGLPIALGGLTPQHELAVLELAADSLGEIAEAARIVRPTVAVVTNVSDSHLTAFGSREAVAREKAALLDEVVPGGVAILNADDPLVRAMTSPASVARVRVGRAADADLRLVDVEGGWEGLRIRLREGAREVTLETSLLGEHQAQLVAQAAAAARWLGSPWDEIAAGVRAAAPLPGRMIALAGVEGSRLLDDSYSANPASVLAALDTLAALPVHGRRTLVLGDMSDLGALAVTWHERVGERAAQVADSLVTLGDLAARAGLAACRSGLSAEQVTLCHATGDAVAAARRGLGEGDVVLVKGSAESRMEEVVRALMAEPERAPQLLARQHAAFGQAHTAMPGRPAWLEIDMEAVAGNVRILRELIGPEVALMAVLKGDAYGHGAIRVGRTALNNGATALGVASLNEAVALRDAGIEAPILILGYLPPWEAREAVAQGIAVALYDRQVARALSRAAQDLGRPAVAHLKVETGMGRLGVQPEEVAGLVQEALGLPGLAIEGIFSHLATADEPDLSYARWQQARFERAIQAARAVGCRPRWVHLANSAATLRLPEARYNLVRPGIALYGLAPSAAVPLPEGMRPAMQFKCQVAQVRWIDAGASVGYGRSFVASQPTRVAVIPVGYADGFRRGPRNWGEVLVRGQRAPLLGNVCMDQTMIDVTAIPGVRAGDEVVLIGRQGQEAITAEDVAARLGTIHYEVISALLARVPRLS